MPPVQLIDRGVIRVSGEDARTFLQGLVTNDMEAVTPESAGYGALLTPQGKIICDFLIIAVPEEDRGGFLLDTPLLLVPDLMKRLKLYKLRAKVGLDDLSEVSTVIASAGGFSIREEAGLVYADPRLPELGRRDHRSRRRLKRSVTRPREADAYHARRITLGVPDGGRDFVYGDTFPHEALLDQLGGVSFKKGCYIGQEVVSRMQHRGTARTRVVPVIFRKASFPKTGAEATAGGPRRSVGSAPAPGGAAWPCCGSTVSRMRSRRRLTLDSGGLSLHPRRSQASSASPSRASPV